MSSFSRHKSESSLCRATASPSHQAHSTTKNTASDVDSGNQPKVKHRGSKGDEDRGRNSKLGSSSLDRRNGNPSMCVGDAVRYVSMGVIGRGAFGVVFQAKVKDTDEIVAIKRVTLDPKHKNRELETLQHLSHQNICRLLHFFTTGRNGNVELNMVLEYVPQTLHRIIRNYSRRGIPVPATYSQVYMFQLLRGLAYLKSQGIAHRDLKPGNILVNPRTNVLKICDFGCAKKLTKDGCNISYICSRFYRAPELLLDSVTYTTDIDTWSCGCILAEMLLGKPLFAGQSQVDQVVEVIKVLGTPSPADVAAMNKDHKGWHLHSVKRKDWKDIFGYRATESATDLLSKMLRYNPSERIEPLQALAHPYFDFLRQEHADLLLRLPLPTLFNFSAEEFSASGPLVRDILPAHIYEVLHSKYRGK